MGKHNVINSLCDAIKQILEFIHECLYAVWYLRIALAVSINTYRSSDVWVHADLLYVVLQQIHLSCEVVDTLHWGGEVTMDWIEGGLSYYILAGPQLQEGKRFETLH